MMEVTIMKTHDFIVKTANKIYEGICEGLETLEKENKATLKNIQNDDFDTGFAKIDALVKCIGANMKGVTIDDVGLPSFLSSISAVEGKLDEVDVTVKSRLKARNKVRQVQTVKVDEDFVANVGKLFLDTLFELYYMEWADLNVQKLNERIATILEEEKIPFGLEFAVTNTSGRIVAIDDKKVVLKAQIEEALKLATNGLLIEVGEDTDDYDKMVAEEARSEFVAIMRTIQITPEILKKKIDIVEKLADLHTKKHSNKLIREGYHKKVENLKNAKSGVGYFSQRVKIDGKDVDVFALLSRDDDGKYEVVLSPYDTDTNTAVDFDVVKAVQ